MKVVEADRVRCCYFTDTWIRNPQSSVCEGKQEESYESLCSGLVAFSSLLHFLKDGMPRNVLLSVRHRLSARLIN